MKILLATDGSKVSLEAAKFVVNHIKELGGKPEIQLVNVQPRLPGRAQAASNAGSVRSFYQEESGKALAGAKKILDQKGIPYAEQFLLGDPGEAIAKHAKAGGFDMIIMGSHARGTIASTVLGSAVRDVLADCKVPVLIIR